jgi:hypothetical protein
MGLIIPHAVPPEAFLTKDAVGKQVAPEHNENIFIDNRFRIQALT